MAKPISTIKGPDRVSVNGRTICGAVQTDLAKPLPLRRCNLKPKHEGPHSWAAHPIQKVRHE